MVHQSGEGGHRQHQDRQLFMGDDSLQISQSVERHSGWQWGVPWNWRSQQPAFISSGFFPMRCNCLTAWGYRWMCHHSHRPILHKYVFLMKMYSKKTKERQKKSTHEICWAKIRTHVFLSFLSLDVCSYLWDFISEWEDSHNTKTDVWHNFLLMLLHSSRANNCLIIDLLHSSHFGKTRRKNTGVPNDADEGSVPFRSNRAKELLLCL